MMQKITGRKYKFEVGYVNGDSNTMKFFIKAICKKTKRYSCICNLNTILSEYRTSIKNISQMIDSTWIVKKSLCPKLVKNTRELLFDKEYLKYLERHLDYDRQLGEWENRNN